MGWSELEGIANRTDYDLKAHSRSPENPDAVGELRYFDQEQKKHIVPYVIEPSAGADRATLAFLCDAYDESLVKEPPAEETTKLRELVQSFAKSVEKRDPKPMDPAVKERLVAAAEKIAAGLPGSLPRAAGAVGRRRRQPDRGLQEGARRLREAGRGVHAHGAAPAPAAGAHHGGGLPAEEERAAPGRDGARRSSASCRRRGLRAVYDDTGAIGKLYRRQDEIGTPFCITVDFQSLEDHTVTVATATRWRRSAPGARRAAAAIALREPRRRERRSAADRRSRATRFRPGLSRGEGAG